MKTFFLTALLSFTLAGCAEAQNNVAADADGSKYVPYEQRTGNRQKDSYRPTNKCATTSRAMWA